MTLFILSAAGIYALDRLTKYLAMGLLEPGESVPVIKGVIHITLVHNTGAAFGIFREHPGTLLVITLVLTAVIIRLLARKSGSMDIFEKAAFSSILAGALGNITDRLKYGFVVDFIDLRFWPVFNVADSFITIGVSVLIIRMFLRAISGTSKKSSA